MHGRAVVVGVGESRYYKRGEATESEFQLACIAIRNAVDDAGLTMREVDGVVSYMERNEPVRLSAALGMGDLAFTAQTFGGGGNGAGAAVTLADAAISAGYARCVVAFRSLAQGQFGRYGQSGRSRRSRGAGAFTVPYGIQTPAQICAMPCCCSGDGPSPSRPQPQKRRGRTLTVAIRARSRSGCSRP